VNALNASELWIVYALVFGTVLLAVQGLYVLLFRARRQKAAINRRLALATQLDNPTEVLDVLRRERGVEFLSRVASLRQLNDLIIQSGVRAAGFSFILVFVVIGLANVALLTLALRSPVLAFGLAVPATLGLVYLYLRRARHRRIASFGEQFPDALDVMVRGLRAGHPFRVSLGLVAREMPDPVGSEFGIVADEVMFGLEQSAAIDNLCRRVGQGDLLFFATAVNIQHQTGGNLAEILSRLSRLLRSRSKLRLKIRALSSEGRLSAVALSLAPFVLFGVISLISPEYFMSVRNHPIIPPIVTVCLAALVVGNIVMYRMVNFKF
jgi:tight adherence protein B